MSAVELVEVEMGEVELTEVDMIEVDMNLDCLRRVVALGEVAGLLERHMIAERRMLQLLHWP